ncbi:hypothetical protein DC498_04715 [Terrimonas sp.]|uniref:hypothetical protein n=1 Tax=Terrimonas sp. TaxID=1914338 RepID=UPI000D524A11|nr:hypothetical protein [Terrimonas sp.]PVD53183.1 hypothetical protein DC498_04715 [Terrimonas sp.]
MKNIIVLIVTVVFVACGAQKTEHNVFGKWSVKFKSGPLAEVRFHKDGTHDYIIDGKLFSSGKSVFSNDTLKTFDPICNDEGEYYGIYKVDFLQGDSIRFIAIEDSCKPRVYDINNAVLHRINP